MALTVYLVDKKTRLIMPDSQWGRSALRTLASLGHEVEETAQNPAEVQELRSDEEHDAAMALLDKVD